MRTRGFNVQAGNGAYYTANCKYEFLFLVPDITEFSYVHRQSSEEPVGAYARHSMFIIARVLIGFARIHTHSYEFYTASYESV